MIFSRSISVIMLIGALAMIGCGDDEPAVDAPNARFSTTIEGLTVTFMDASIGAESYSWDFGDGNTSTQASPTNTYETGGTYEVTLTVTNAGGESTSSETLILDNLFSESFLAGSWSVPASLGALSVGPSQGSSEWWSLPMEDLELRTCQFDDQFIFGSDGSLSIDLQGESFIEDWQGGDFSCGPVVAPHDGTGTYAFEISGTQLTVNGDGVFIGLPKLTNAGELPNVAVASSITFDVVEFTQDGDSKTMQLSIETGSGVFWTVNLASN